MSDDRLKRIEENTDQLIREVTRQGVVLDEHQRRSLALEASVAMLREKHAPLETHVAMWSGAMKALTVAAVVLSVVLTVYKLLGH